MEYLDLGVVYGKSRSADVEFEMENINGRVLACKIDGP